jgi:hypothetical protein
MMPDEFRKDTRIAYGSNCPWWDSIYNVGHINASNGATLPCCPHCRGMLFEMQSEQQWFAGVDKYEADGHPGYRALIEWSRGKCFSTFEAARHAYDAEKLA